MSTSESNAPSANLSGNAPIAVNNKPVPVKTVLLGKWNTIANLGIHTA